MRPSGGKHTCAELGATCGAKVRCHPARSRLSAAGGVAKQPDPVCSFVLCNEHICPLSLLLCTGSALLFYFVVLYCIVEAHPPFVDSISLQALLNSFFATRYQTHQVPYAVSNSKSLKWKSINCAHTYLILVTTAATGGGVLFPSRRPCKHQTAKFWSV